MDIMEDLYTTTFSNNESFFKKAAAEIESLRAQIAELKAENERLRMALADTEALEIGTAERCAKLTRQRDEYKATLKAAYEIAVGHDDGLPFDWAIYCEMLHKTVEGATE